MTAPPIIVRPAVPADADAVSALLAASYPVLMAPAYDAETLGAALPVMTRASPQLLASGAFHVALAGGEGLAGCGGWSFGQPGTGALETGLAHIRHFATHPAQTRRGVGRAILSRCEQEARAAGADRLECWSSLNGVGFYAALGFEPLEQFDVRMGPVIAFPSVRMRKSIA